MPGRSRMSRLLLPAALGLIALWVVFTFVLPTGLGITHLLLGAGAVLFVRWWALRDESAPAA